LLCILQKIAKINNEIRIDSEAALPLKLTGKEIKIELEEVKECFEAYENIDCRSHNKNPTIY
jgi:hypothetical protein